MHTAVAAAPFRRLMRSPCQSSNDQGDFETEKLMLARSFRLPGACAILLQEFLDDIVVADIAGATARRF